MFLPKLLKLLLKGLSNVLVPDYDVILVVLGCGPFGVVVASGVYDYAIYDGKFVVHESWLLVSSQLDALCFEFLVISILKTCLGLVDQDFDLDTPLVSPCQGFCKFILCEAVNCEVDVLVGDLGK